MLLLNNHNLSSLFADLFTESGLAPADYPQFNEETDKVKLQFGNGLAFINFCMWVVTHTSFSIDMACSDQTLTIFKQNLNYA